MRFYFPRMVSFGMEDFAKRYGDLKPSQFVDIISLMGDKADNIPGRVDASFYGESIGERKNISIATTGKAQSN